jgi:membrane associated rhomboid family serine protease
VRAGNRGTRQVGTVFGGRAISGAVVTWALVVINVALYLIELARPSLGYDLGMIGLGRFTNGGPLQGVAEGQWYRLITSAFLPPPGGGLGPLDIIFNMWALILVGPALEHLLGRLRFLAVYVLSALGGSVLFYLLAPVSEWGLGASGAIFGLFGAYFVVARRLRLDTRSIVFLIVLNLGISFAVAGIAWQAHVGGLLTGGLLTAAYAYAPRNQRTLVQVGATVAVVAVLVIAVLARTHQVMP